MDQSRAINALAPFIALTKSANSPRAASDLVTQATSAANTYVFSELLQQPNIQALVGHEQYGNYHTLLQCFAWGTWESYKSTPNLPALSDAQALKLRFLSLLTIASSKTSNLRYSHLCARLDLASTIDLEHLITQAIYNGLITGTLNPASQTVIITSVAPLRDPAPGSVQTMMAELSAWSGRCDAMLADLEGEIRKVKSEAEKRSKRDIKAEKQIRALMDDGKGKEPGAGPLAPNKGAANTRGAMKREQQLDDEDEDEDAMDLDEPGRTAGGGRKKSGGSGSVLSRAFKR